MDQQTLNTMKAERVEHTIFVDPPTPSEAAQIVDANTLRMREAELTRWLQHDRVSLRTLGVLLGDPVASPNKITHNVKVLVGQARFGLLKLADNLDRIREGEALGQKRRNPATAKVWRDNFKDWLDVHGRDMKGTLAEIWANHGAPTASERTRPEPEAAGAKASPDR